MNDIPHEICINITRRCNLHCSYCYVYDYINQHNYDSRLDLSFEKMKSLIEDLPFDGVYLTGGEPFMHPDIKEIINYFFNSGKKISIATNGLILNEEMIHFLDHKGIALLISLREEFKDTFRVIKMLEAHDIETICYHIPTTDSPYLLSKLLVECMSVKKIKLLYDSKSPKNSSEWFALLHEIYRELTPYLNRIDVSVETAFLPKKHIIALDKRRGAFDRIQISTEGLFYYCPLLVSNTEGTNQLPIPKCNTTICPIISKQLDDENYASVCCFLSSSLEYAIKVGKYGGAI